MRPLLLGLAGAVLSAVIVAVGTVISAGLHWDFDDDPWDVADD